MPRQVGKSASKRLCLHSLTITNTGKFFWQFPRFCIYPRLALTLLVWNSCHSCFCGLANYLRLDRIIYRLVLWIEKRLPRSGSGQTYFLWKLHFDLFFSRSKKKRKSIKKKDFRTIVFERNTWHEWMLFIYWINTIWDSMLSALMQIKIKVKKQKQYNKNKINW